MKIPFRLISLITFVIFVAACQPRIQPIYIPSSVALPPGLETAPLSAIGDGILAAGAEKGWVMEKRSPGVIRTTLGVRGKHEAVVDVVYTNQSFDINYVSSRNLASQGARIHRGYNTWVRELEISIENNLGYVAAEQKANPTEAAPLAAVPKALAFDPAGIWNVSATYSATAMSASFCPKQRSWNFQLDYRRRGRISETYWSNSVQLNVTGEHSQDYSELVFSVPAAGADWQLTERLKLDKPLIRLTSEPKFSSGSISASNCVGVVDILMAKQDRPGLAISPSAAARNSAANDYDTTGRWRVSAQYEAVSGKSAYCAKPHVWDFDLTLSNTPQSYTFWTGSEGLYVNSTIENGRLVLALNYPNGGSNWQWSDRFRLDQDQKNFFSEARGAGGGHAGCVGKIIFTMKKQSSASISGADIAWRNLEDKQDPAALRQFLKEHLDSKYASVAILNLNEALARSSEVAATAQNPAGYKTRGRGALRLNMKPRSVIQLIAPDLICGILI
ncbi:MAG: hypothetical protein V7701_07045 [Sneathiella sp.]